VIAVAPGYVITILQPDYSRVIAILIPTDLWVIAQPINGFVLQPPVKAIIAEATMQVHLALFVIATENARKFALERHNCAVENTVQ
jgi:hypothetical protein